MSLTGALELRKLMLPALGAGVAAGLVVAILQQLLLMPMIFAAEAIELGSTQPVHHGMERALSTTLFDCLGAFGFALLLSVGYALRGGVSLKEGLFWGLAGFASFALAPALGLPPELPGVESAPLIARQLWWIGTAASTAGGIACVVLVRQRITVLVGVALVVIPHLIGAPGNQIAAVISQPLARSFAAGSLMVSAVMWILLGVLTALLMKRGALSDLPASRDASAGV